MRGRSTLNVLSVFRLRVFSDPAGIRNGRNLQRKQRGKVSEIRGYLKSSWISLSLSVHPLPLRGRKAISGPISATLTPLPAKNTTDKKAVDLGERRGEAHGQEGVDWTFAMK